MRKNTILIVAVGGAVMLAGAASAQRAGVRGPVGGTMPVGATMHGTASAQAGVRTDRDETMTGTRATTQLRADADRDRDDRMRGRSHRHHGRRLARGHFAHSHFALGAERAGVNASATVRERDEMMRGDHDRDSATGARDSDANGDLHSTIRGPTSDPDANGDTHSGVSGSAAGSTTGMTGGGMMGGRRGR